MKNNSKIVVVQFPGYCHSEIPGVRGVVGTEHLMAICPRPGADQYRRKTKLTGWVSAKDYREFALEWIRVHMNIHPDEKFSVVGHSIGVVTMLWVLAHLSDDESKRFERVTAIGPFSSIKWEQLKSGSFWWSGGAWRAIWPALLALLWPFRGVVLSAKLVAHSFLNTDVLSRGERYRNKFMVPDSAWLLIWQLLFGDGIPDLRKVIQRWGDRFKIFTTQKDRLICEGATCLAVRMAGGDPDRLIEDLPSDEAPHCLVDSSSFFIDQDDEDVLRRQILGT